MPGIEVAERIPAGHKLALRVIPQGEPIRKYNQIIGFASQSIPAGTHVHSHNTEMRPFERDYAFGVDKKEDDPVATPATFAGYLRADGRVGTRNYLAVLSSVNCSAQWLATSPTRSGTRTSRRSFQMWMVWFRSRTAPGAGEHQGRGPDATSQRDGRIRNAPECFRSGAGWIGL